MNFRDVPIPSRMQKLSRDKRGYPIPFIVAIDPSGTPQFTINDHTKIIEILRNDLCPICGQPNTRGRWFVGGPLAAFHPQGAYLDPPGHNECIHYALQVCPFLATTRYNNRIDDKKVAENDKDKILIFNDYNAVADQPQVFVAVQSSKTKNAGPYVRPSKPYMSVEYWRGGIRLDDNEGRSIVNKVLEEHQG